VYKLGSRLYKTKEREKVSIVKTAEVLKKSSQAICHFYENSLRRIIEVKTCADKCIEGLKDQHRNLQELNAKVVKMNATLAQSTAKLKKINEKLSQGNKKAETCLANLKKEQAKPEKPYPPEIDLADEMLGISLQNLPENKLIKAN